MVEETTQPIDFFDMVIIGGGIAGGSLAAALAHEDGDVRILLVEQTKQSSAINRGDFIQPPHIELLERWGVLDEMLRRGAVSVTHNEFHSNSGDLLLRHDFSFFGTRYNYGIALEHSAIEESILEVALRHPMITIWRNTRYVGVSEWDGNTWVHLSQDNHTFAVQTSCIIAADGRNSKVRNDAGIESVTRDFPYEILMTRMPSIPEFRNITQQYIGKHGYLGLFIANSSYTRVAIPLIAGKASSFIQATETERNNEIRQRAAGLETAKIMWEDHHLYKLMEHHATTYNKGRVILIGDAAHTLTPMLGMGMNLAIEEAATLATLLSRRSFLKNLSNTAIKEYYEDHHRYRNQRIIDESRRQGDMLATGGKISHIAVRTSFCIASHFLPLQRTLFRRIFSVTLAQ